MATSYLQYPTSNSAVDMPPVYRGPCSLVLPAVVLCYAATATCKGTWPGHVLRRGLAAAVSAQILDGHLFRSELQLRALGAPVRPRKLGKNSKLYLVGFDESPDGRCDGWLKALAAAAHIGVQYPPRRRRRVLVHFKQHIILAVAVRRHVRVPESGRWSGKMVGWLGGQMVGWLDHPMVGWLGERVVGSVDGGAHSYSTCKILSRDPGFES
mmetsp:Transcript_5956/g.14363  ORF Transcript_5956/g.14363 Transcript_5956/m.14363 type:complete len:211 (-) Transcript_5956:1699-2331(-)